MHKMNLEKINKIQAKKLFEEGGEVYLINSKYNPYYMDGCMLCQIKKSIVMDCLDFAKMINSFSYYNLQKKSDRIAYYIEQTF